MNTLRESPYVDHFPRMVGISIAAHVAVVLFFMVRAAIVPSDELLVRTAIRVDMVALPDKPAAPTPPTPVAPPAPAPTAKPAVPVAKVEPAKPVVLQPKKVEKTTEKTPDLKQLQENQRRALEQIKAQSSIENLKNEMAERDAKPKAPTFKGNVVNQGEGLTGLEKIEFDRYFSDIEKKLKQHWNLPKWLVEAKLRGQALVTLDASGQVVRRQILTSSGNEVFDAQVLAAIDGASPFPEPPARLKNVLALKGIVFNFPN